MTETDKKFKFHAPATILVTGGTGSGKTELVKKIILYAQELFTTKVHKIIYVYNEQMIFFKELENVEFVQNIEQLDIDELSKNKNEHKLLIVDDQL